MRALRSLYIFSQKTHSRQFGHSLRKSFQFGRQHSLPSGNTPSHPSQTLPHAHSQLQQQPPQPTCMTPLPQYRFYRAGIPANMMRPGMPPFYYQMAPGAGVIRAAPGIPPRGFHRAPMPVSQQQQQQGVYPQAFMGAPPQAIPQARGKKAPVSVF